MFQQSVDQVVMVAEKFMKANENRSDTSKELKAIGLFIVDHLDVFQAIMDKLQHVASFRSLEGEIREIFVQRLLREISGIERIVDACDYEIFYVLN